MRNPVEPALVRFWDGFNTYRLGDIQEDIRHGGRWEIQLDGLQISGSVVKEVDFDLYNWDRVAMYTPIVARRVSAPLSTDEKLARAITALEKYVGYDDESLAATTLKGDSMKTYKLAEGFELVEAHDLYLDTVNSDNEWELQGRTSTVRYDRLRFRDTPSGMLLAARKIAPKLTTEQKLEKAIACLTYLADFDGLAEQILEEIA